MDALEPITEADPNAVLVQFLAAAGNLLGNAPHVRVGEKRHGLRIWPVMVGATAGGATGVALRECARVLKEAGALRVWAVVAAHSTG
ncbi:MAG: hypothetical protein FD129_1619, partial [bacterium]